MNTISNAQVCKQKSDLLRISNLQKKTKKKNMNFIEDECLIHYWAIFSVQLFNRPTFQHPSTIRHNKPNKEVGYTPNMEFSIVISFLSRQCQNFQNRNIYDLGGVILNTMWYIFFFCEVKQPVQLCLCYTAKNFSDLTIYENQS